MARDDDIDYTILGLHVLETTGSEYTSADVAQAWLERLPFLQVYTAERAAYRNLVHGVAAAGHARVRNPYREWIGAQIRADISGYVCPGDPPGAAARLRRRVAVALANGIYGEKWAAALIAAAFTRHRCARGAGGGALRSSRRDRAWPRPRTVLDTPRPRRDLG